MLVTSLLMTSHHPYIMPLMNISFQWLSQKQLLRFTHNDSRSSLSRECRMRMIIGFLVTLNMPFKTDLGKQIDTMSIRRNKGCVLRVGEQSWKPSEDTTTATPRGLPGLWLRAYEEGGGHLVSQQWSIHRVKDPDSCPHCLWVDYWLEWAPPSEHIQARDNEST